MDFNLTILTVSGSALTAVVATKTFEFFSAKQKKKEERYYRLYAPLIFDLIMLDLNDENKKQLFEHFNQTRKEWTTGKEGHEQGEIIMDITHKRSEVTNSLVKHWWFYIERIRKLLEDCPQYIKREDLPIFRKFLDAYIKREVIGKDSSGNNTLVYIPEEKATDYTDNILKIVTEMQDKFLP